MPKALLLSTFLAWISPPGPSLVVDQPSPYADSLMRDPSFAVLVVRVTEATVQFGTNESPPHGALVVEEVLRGRHISLADYGYRIMAPQGHSDRDEERNLRAEWYSEELHGPAAGDRLIVFTVASAPKAPGSSLILQGPLIRFTRDVRRQVEARLEHDSRLLLPLAFLTLLLPVIAMGSLLSPRAPASATGLRRWLPRLPLTLPPLALVSYLLYEWLMSPVYNIRIDLLILWPALALGAIVWVFAVIREFSTRQQSGGA